MDFFHFKCRFSGLSAGFGVLSAGFPKKKRKNEKNWKMQKKSKFLGKALPAVP